MSAFLQSTPSLRLYGITFGLPIASKKYMRHILILIFTISVYSLWAQPTDELVEDFCSNSIDCGHFILEPSEDPNQISFLTSCPVSSIEDYALLSSLELFDILIDSIDAYSCVYRNLVSYSTIYSPLVFSDDHVGDVALLAKGYFSTFDGINDNGSYALMVYLGLAVQFSGDFSQDIHYSAGTWLKVKDAILAYANNTATQSETPIALYTTASFLSAAARDSLNSEPVIIEYVGNMLDRMANDSYVQLDNIYPYYFCYYFLLDIYFRYAPLNQAFVDELSAQLDVIESLKEVAINKNLNAKTFVYFGDLSSFSVTGLTNMVDYHSIQPQVIDALQEVSTTYDEYSPQWLTSAFALAEHDDTYQYDVEDLTAGLRALVLPNTFVFDEGKFIIETALDYEQSLSLYEASQQVKAQFFRLMGDHSAVIDDDNDTLTAVVYGTRQEYADYNGLLYGISYPNSGGVYIESFGTFFTYERLPTESSFTVEELFRHEYTHYLQGRYLIPGDWGIHQIYQNNRMVWFEEGMAQFLSGSTRTDGVLLINVIRERINKLNGIQDFDDIFSSSYGSGNAHAFYDFSPLLWSYWYEHDRTLVDELFRYVKTEAIESFDSLINVIEHDTLHEQLYLQYIDDIIDHDSLWIVPHSAVSPYDSMMSVELSDIASEITHLNPNFAPSMSDIISNDDHSRFKISGTWQGGSMSSIEDELNILLSSLASSASNDPLNYSIGYYALDMDNDAEAPFFIEGPIGSFCPLPGNDPAVYVDSSYAILFHFSNSDQSRELRIREMNTADWDYESSTSLYYIDSILNIVSNQGYEYQIRYQCDENSWSQYSQTYTLYPCPQMRQVSGDLSQSANYFSADHINVDAQLSGEFDYGFYAPQSVSLKSGFVLSLGSELLIDHSNCSQGDFTH